MPVVSENQLKGNWGEHLVAMKLAAAGCLVRLVPSGTDVGVDLYCETTEVPTSPESTGRWHTASLG